MYRRYPLHRRTRQILASLEKEHGAPLPWLDCFELVAEIDEKVRRCFEPAEIDRIAILDQAIRCGNVDFYALSHMALDWYDEFCRSFPNAPAMHEAAYLYASAHSMKPEVLNRAWPEKEKIAWEVFSFRSSCGVKPGQIPALMRLLNPPIPWPESERTDESVERGGYSGSGWMVSDLCKMKQDPEFWRSGCSMLRAMQDYRNCKLYGEPDMKMRNVRWDHWQAAACVDEQKAIRNLSDWLAKWKAKISARPSVSGQGTQASRAPETVRVPEKERGEKSATENGGEPIPPTMAQEWPKDESGDKPQEGAGQAVSDSGANVGHP